MGVAMECIQWNMAASPQEAVMIHGDVRNSLENMSRCEAKKAKSYAFIKQAVLLSGVLRAAERAGR